MLLSSKGGECVTVVGVLGGFWYRSILERELWHVYVPMAQSTFGLMRPEYMFIAVRSDPVAVMGAVRHALQRVRPDMPAVSVTRMRDVVDPEIRPWRLATTMFPMFANVALLIRDDPNRTARRQCIVKRGRSSVITRIYSACQMTAAPAPAPPC